MDIKELYKQGLSIRQIAEQLSMPKGRVDKYLKDNKIPKRTKSESIALRLKNNPRDKSTYARGKRSMPKGITTHSLIGNSWEIKPTDLRADRKGVMCLFVNGKRVPQTDKVGFMCEVSGEYVEKVVSNFVRNPVLKSRDVCIGEKHKGKTISEKQRKQISENNSGEKIKKYFDFTCPVCGETFQYRDIQRNRIKKYCSKECQLTIWAVAPAHLMEENQLEKDFRKEIEHQGYVVETQKQFGYYPVDCYLPEIDVILQVDGTYWHAKPGLYEEDELDDLQKRHRVCDARFASYCENKGLKYARVSLIVIMLYNNWPCGT
jgi:predicted RNA-binding Zn-ribbon protein involved in translation (DUF1610 family)/transcriptional regulator with XRE-family HTH domain